MTDDIPRRNIYELLEGMQADITEMKVSFALTSAEQPRLRREVDDQEKRIRTIEAIVARSSWITRAATGTLAFIGGIFITNLFTSFS